MAPDWRPPATQSVIRYQICTQTPYLPVNATQFIFLVLLCLALNVSDDEFGMFYLWPWGSRCHIQTWSSPISQEMLSNGQSRQLWPGYLFHPPVRAPPVLPGQTALWTSQKGWLWWHMYQCLRKDERKKKKCLYTSPEFLFFKKIYTEKCLGSNLKELHANTKCTKKSKGLSIFAWHFCIPFGAKSYSKLTERLQVIQKDSESLQIVAQGIKQGYISPQLTCGVKASQLAVDSVNVEPGGYLFAFLDACIGAQWAWRLWLHLGGCGILLQHDRWSAMFCGVGCLLDNTPERSRKKMFIVN